MQHTHARNVNEAFAVGLINFKQAIKNETLLETKPRGQRRLEWPTPYSTTYHRPQERVLFSPVRDANPFFQLMEALWILAGRDDVDWLKYWLPSIADYSDDGVKFHGAYGKRLWSHRQIENIERKFRKDRESTRCVLAVYDPWLDADYDGKDLPCNCTVFLRSRPQGGIQVLDLTVANRSNDLIWGAYGTNIVQFSMLQEYLAARLGFGIGRYTQFSNNTHVYPDNEATKRCLDAPIDFSDPYADTEDTINPMCALPLINDLAQWDEDLQEFMMLGETTAYREPFFNGVAVPMAEAFREYRVGELVNAMAIAGSIAAPDWRLACVDWLNRRWQKKLAARGVDHAA